ncbi:MAG: hypothetical protein N5P05_002621 [Chroococcopsis gigantea SAG 12.99]|jgi:hypothetical protein|nr:hypothetical protein [Chroococcopsis gigantea SAG 12.99]
MYAKSPSRSSMTQITLASTLKKKSIIGIFSTIEAFDKEFTDVDEGLLPLDNIGIEK